MFDRYTEPARRVVFWARLEASEFGAKEIDTEHLLIGVLREATPPLSRLFPANLTTETVRHRLRRDRPCDEKVSTSVDMPLSKTAKQALVFAAATELQIDVAHLLLGIAQQESCPAAIILREHGLTLPYLRKEVER